MPTIVFATPKGGASKSTSAVLLATELANRGGAVTVIDADAEDLSVAKALFENRMKASGTVTQIVTTEGKTAKRGDTRQRVKSAG
jgi:cellulose biosynthesis protein BcsQ